MSNNCEKKNFFAASKRLRGEVKHAILKYYLGAYFAILGQTKYPFDRVIYVDGFSGPGKYVKEGAAEEDDAEEDAAEEEGSPLVAINAAIDHMHYKKFNKPIEMYFIDEKEEYTNRLQITINEILVSKQVDQTKLSVTVLNGRFEEKMTEILDGFENIRCPMLVFADPFGIKPVPMELMRRIINRPVTELFVNVMTSLVIRWFKSPKFNNVLNALLGEENCEWKKSVFDGDENKSELFIKYYVEKLTEGNPKFYRHKFGMKDLRNRHLYQLVFVTQYRKALKNMKRAMIKNSQETETCVYSEYNENHPERCLISKMSKEQIRPILVEKIKEKFDGQTVCGRDITRFVWEETPYLFNLKKELKRDFKEFCVRTSRRFKYLLFDFSRKKKTKQTAITKFFPKSKTKNCQTIKRI